VDNYFRVLKVYTGRNKLLEIHVSTSEFIGEGEHKIFNHVRKAGNYAKTLAVYGLDADLIVLSLFNLSYCDNMFFD
jgi:5'-3' exonuclease